MSFIAYNYAVVLFSGRNKQNKKFHHDQSVQSFRRCWTRRRSYFRDLVIRSKVDDELRCVAIFSFHFVIFLQFQFSDDDQRV